MKKKYKITLVTINSSEADYPAFGLMTLVAYMDAHKSKCLMDFEISIITLAQESNLEQFLTQLKYQKADLIGLSCYVWNFNTIMNYIPFIKTIEPRAKIVLGGPHISATDNLLLDKLDRGEVDYLVTGDGEEALLEIINNEFLLSCERIVKTKNIYEGYVADLNTLPNPYIQIPYFRMHIMLFKSAILETNRGCPYHCTFCDQGWRKLRHKEVGEILNEIDALYSFGARKIVFLDPTFNIKSDRTFRILGFINEKFPDLFVHLEIKVDRLKVDDISLLKTFSNISIEVGLQSSNEETLKKIKRATNLNKMRENIMLLQKEGIIIAINTIYGLPGEKLEDWLNTLDFCYSLGHNVFITASALKILPNTEVYNKNTDLKFNHEKMNIITSSDTFTQNDILLASKLHKVIDELMVKSRSEKQIIYDEVKLNYNNRLSDFLLHQIESTIV